jgi:hypothetical protein
MRQNIALRDDSLPGDFRVSRPKTSRQLIRGLTDDLDMPFHGPAKHSVVILE